jgi:glutathione S-transferase
MTYELYYWPGLQGRGEFIRLALEDAGAPYIDVARSAEHGGVRALQAMMAGSCARGPSPFAPPFLKTDDLVLAQVANILHFLGPKLELVGATEASRHHALQLQLTIADLIAEVHDTHHPASTQLYYEDQKPEALRRTQSFLDARLPKFLGYLERNVQDNSSGAGAHLLGAEHCYVDLSVYQIVEGLRYAFPTAMKAMEPKVPGLVTVHNRVAERPRIKAYVASGRRIAFNENGIFRRYPELDLVPSWASATT